MKILLSLLIILFTPISALLAQVTNIDSTLLKTKIAIDDAKYFRINKQIWKAYKNHQVIYSSDYFKPTLINTIHPELLIDSTYVKAFKQAAFKKIIKRRTVGHYILKGYIAGIIIGVIVFIISLGY